MLLRILPGRICSIWTHGLGKNIKHYGVDRVVWGTDCLWWGSPQWGIDAFKRFQMPDEMCEKFGYKKLSKQDKAKIFGLNAAKLYKIDVRDEWVDMKNPPMRACLGVELEPPHIVEIVVTAAK